MTQAGIARRTKAPATTTKSTGGACTKPTYAKSRRVDILGVDFKGSEAYIVNMETNTLLKQPKDGLPPAEGVCKAKTKAKYSLARGECRSCHAPLRATGRRSLAKFCSDKCRNDFSNRLKVQGAAIIAQVKRWQMAPRGKARGKELSLLEKMARELVAQDREDGVTYLPPPPTSAYAKVVGRNVGGGRRSNALVSG